MVDDDRDILALLAEQLGKSGYHVSTAADGSEMRKSLRRSAVDLIVLDLNLPREDGLDLCRSIRSDSNVPIIILTARDTPIDRIIGLEMGADDYIPKPFEPRELLARIRSVMRRANAVPTNMEAVAARLAHFSGWTLDLQRRVLLDPGRRLIMLSGAEFHLLRLLVEYANCVLTRDQLQRLGLRGRAGSAERSVDLRISRLRQKFGGTDGDGLIRTVRNEGYVLASPVAFE